MIRFIRRIRHQLLDSGRITRYLAYAGGEIILVVIGILIALQINNWNESRKDRKSEVQILSAILENLSEDKANLNISINSFETNKRYIARFYETPRLPYDSVAYLFTQAYLINDFRPIQSAYELSISSGKMDLIRDKKLTQMIQRLYTLDYEADAINLEILKEYHTQMRHLTDRYDALDFGEIRGGVDLGLRSMQMPFNNENVWKVLSDKEAIRMNKQYRFNLNMIVALYRGMLASRDQVELAIKQYLSTRKI